MAIADTARLLASLELKDNFTKTARAAETSLGRLEKRVGGVGSAAAKGFKKLGSNLKSLISGPLGFIGLGAGLLGLQQFLSGSIDKAQEFADAVMRTQAITGMQVRETSQLVDVLGDYGLAIDKVKNVAGIYGKATGLLTKGNANYRKELKAAEKALGRHLTATEKLRISQKNAIKFQKEFGFNILDANGKVKDFRTALLDAAAVFTDKSIPASRKAALMMKLFGRNWQELIPLLKKGKAGLEATLGKGLVLTEAQQKSLEKSRVATRNWQDALDELQIAIGVELLPAITRLQRRATTFVQEHGSEIVDFFRNAGKFAISMGQAIKNDVLPWIQRIGDFWAGIPDDLKKVLIGGFILNKATGGALTGIVGEIGKGVIKGVLGMTAAVVNLKAGTVTGVGGGVAGAGKTGGVAGALGKVGTAIAVVGSVALVGEALNVAYETGKNIREQTAAVKGKFDAFLSSNPTQQQIDQVIAAQLKVPDSLDPIKRALFEMNVGGVKTTWEEGLAALRAAPAATAAALAPGITRSMADVFKPALGPKMDPAISRALRALGNPRASDKQVIAKLAAAVEAIHAGGAIDEKGYHTLEGAIKDRLRQAIKDGDTVLARKLDRQLGQLERQRQAMREGTSTTKQAIGNVKAAQLQTRTAVVAGAASTARNLDQVSTAIRNKKFHVRVTQNQRQSSVMSLRNAAGGTTAGKPGFHYTKQQGQDLDRFLASGAVGMATQPTRAVFGEAGREAYAILKNPRSGLLGGGGPTVVNVTVNIDPRRITKKQTSSGVYKTYVAS